MCYEKYGKIFIRIKIIFVLRGDFFHSIEINLIKFTRFKMLTKQGKALNNKIK